MEKKAKFIIMGLVGILVISFFINLQTYGSKQAIVRERDDLKKENASLAKKIDESLRDNQRLQDRLNSLNRDLDRIAKEKEEVQKKYDLLTKEREELIQRLKTRPAPIVTEVRPPPAAPAPAEDPYWAGILRAKTDLELQLDNIRNELKTTQIKNEELQRSKSNLELEVNSLNRETQDLKRQLEYNQKTTDSLAQELVREKNDKFQIQNSLNLIKNENQILRRQLKSLSGRKTDLEKKIQQLQEDKSGLERRFTEMETILKDKVSKIDDLKQQLDTIRSSGQSQIDISLQRQESVELPPIIVRPQTEVLAPGTTVSLVGKILAVNKDNNFVIIDLGEDVGIKVGDIFEVYREDVVIATIEVLQTRKNITACDIKRETTPIKVGDTVR